MIISKDLFLLGDQDYLRLPVNEKRQQRAMGRPIINAPRDRQVNCLKNKGDLATDVRREYVK
ncbi:Uncharacterized protein DBV15_10911 [Temnothorax longispinosus]|uniref:Uncharacterized protein n=1 Tax=Temnothorax longispinosus TaxID=300112 RepID=A0A4S2KV10_9HYME|nr:Uncharacterized protein DBV15_10911 [Temnothorax longispinosus]